MGDMISAMKDLTAFERDVVAAQKRVRLGRPKPKDAAFLSTRAAVDASNAIEARRAMWREAWAQREAFRDAISK